MQSKGFVFRRKTPCKQRPTRWARLGRAVSASLALLFPVVAISDKATSEELLTGLPNALVGLWGPSAAACKRHPGIDGGPLLIQKYAMRGVEADCQIESLRRGDLEGEYRASLACEIEGTSSRQTVRLSLGRTDQMFRLDVKSEPVAIYGLATNYPCSVLLFHETQPPPVFADYPAKKIYRGKVQMPQFSGRDRPFREFRTKIREALAEQGRSNFAGRYNAVHIGLTGGFVVAVVESETGRIIWSDVLGGGPYYEYDFRPNSRLLMMQWSNGEDCSLQGFEWTGTQFKAISAASSRPVDGEGVCKDPLSKVLAITPRR